MFDLTAWLAFVAASALIVIVPGPTVTVIIANSLRAGPMAGLMNVAGTQAGLILMVAVLAAGLETIVTQAGVVFDVLRLIGAAYLVWLGVKMWRSDGRLGQAEGFGGLAEVAAVDDSEEYPHVRPVKGLVIFIHIRMDSSH